MDLLNISVKEKEMEEQHFLNVTRGRVNVQLLDSLQAVIYFRQSYLGGKLYRTVNVTLSIIIVHIDYRSELFKSFKFSQFNTVLSNTYFPKTWKHTRMCIQ